jgi:predicted tellurium resistance membrane protein TerC
MLENLFTLVMLVLLQMVLGLDNLLYISMESKNVQEDRQSYVRRWGVGLAIVLRIALLFILIKAIDSFQEPFLVLHDTGIVDMKLNVHAVIVLFGGGFIVYTAVKEVFHLLAAHDIGDDGEENPKSVKSAIFWIVIMNLVFSFDSILSAIALTRVFWVMAVAIVVSGVAMIFLSDQVSAFLKRNRMYEVLGLFILLIVGVMLLSEGGHIGHLAFFGHPIEPMAKSTFYFVLAVLVLVDVVQSKYQRKLMAERDADAAATDAAEAAAAG